MNDTTHDTKSNGHQIPTEAQSFIYFKALQFCLDGVKLPTFRNGSKEMRLADFKEFMLMTAEPDKHLIHFKHFMTRNYLTLDIYNMSISFKSNGLFNRGEF